MRQDSQNQQDLFLEAPVWWEGLTGPRRLFVEYYCTDRTCFLNATQSYIKAFGSRRRGKELTESSIQSNASRLMRDQKIKDAVAKLLRARQNEEDCLSEYQVLGLLKTLSFYNPADMFDKNGSLRPLKDLGELALCVAEVKHSRLGGREYKLYDRTKALAMLSQYLDIIRPADGATIVNPNIFIAAKDMAPQGQPAMPAAEDAEYEVMAGGLP